ncbi:MAG: hypothetical protein ACK56I_03570, partial [bacterium]
MYTRVTRPLLCSYGNTNVDCESNVVGLLDGFPNCVHTAPSNTEESDTDSKAGFGAQPVKCEPHK